MLSAPEPFTLVNSMLREFHLNFFKKLAVGEAPGVLLMLSQHGFSRLSLCESSNIKYIFF